MHFQKTWLRGENTIHNFRKERQKIPQSPRQCCLLQTIKKTIT